MKIVTIVGARPQFIKAAVVSKAIDDYNETSSEKIEEKIIHTGQHFDANMSDVFFNQMNIRKPDYNLDVNSLSHGAMTGQMMEGIEKILLHEKPDWLLVYGDTNSTLAGALAAKKIHVKVAHVEAGLRSFNDRMPEEINRILTDRVSDILFCPTDKALQNLKNEGYDNIDSDVILIGDVMKDAALYYKDLSKNPLPNSLPKKYVLSTIHRAENTDDVNRLNNIFEGLSKISDSINVVIPLHPRTKKILAKRNIKINDNIIILDPVGYLQMVYLIDNCSLVITDSGGLQKEAYFFQKPCITLREETEWVELLENDYSVLVGSNQNKILEAFLTLEQSNFILVEKVELYGKGDSGTKILEALRIK
jgi:UDP-GlcNAc3NAcA epimerase